MRLLTLTLLVVAGVTCFPELNFEQKRWNEFKVKYNKKYDSAEEEQLRRGVWAANIMMINKHNEEANMGRQSYTLAENIFADMTHDEFREMMGQKPVQQSVTKHTLNMAEDLPDSVDWRTKGIVKKVMDEGQLVYGWCFSTTGTIEGQHALATGQLVPLSEINLADCCDSFNVYQCIYDMGGVDTEDGYPDPEKNGTCRFNEKTIGSTITGWESLPQGDEGQLQAAVANIGPISVYVDASRSSFQFYSGGVYNEPECSSEDVDLSMLTIGYGVTSDNVQYYILRNHWGLNWGEQGYMRMIRNDGNKCGIATFATYVTV